MADLTDPRFQNRSYDPSDFSWAVPFMRAGYGGRALVYGVVAGFSLYAIWRGGDAQGTSEALRRLETETWGTGVLLAIALGLLAYMVWRCVDAAWDLEDYGRGLKGLVARTGQVITGLIHGALGVAAGALVFTSGTGSGAGNGSGGDAAGGGGSSSIADLTGKLMTDPGGQIAVAVAGGLTVAAGLYYLLKAVRQSYLRMLRANRFTLNWNRLLQVGVAAQGVAVTIIGGLLAWAAWQNDPSEAGGVGRSFEWLAGQPYGQVLTTALAAGLLLFGLFCLVNALYRIVPKAAGDDTVTLARKLKAAS